MQYCTPLKDAYRDGKKEIGSKAYNLSLLMSFGFPVPRGFVIRTQCFSDFLSSCGIKEKIDGILAGTNADDAMSLSGASHEIKKIILSTEIPDNIKAELTEAYSNISGRDDIAGLNDIARSIMSTGRSEASIAVRGSYPNDELRNSFAGCARASLNTRGKIGFLESIRKAWSSFYSEHAIYYREKTGTQNIGFAVLVQLMVHPEKAGTIFTANPLTGDKNQEIIEAVWGTGESLALGATTPDRYIISKESRMISDYSIGRKEWMYAEDDFSGGTKKEPVSERTRATEVLSHAEIKTLDEIARKIDERAGIPQDIEWAISRGRIYVLQARPVIFGHEQYGTDSIPAGDLITSGVPVSMGAAEGKPRIIHDLTVSFGMEQGNILVLRDASPAMLSALKGASAIASEEGGMLSPAATLMREFGIPMIAAAKGIMDAAGKSAKIHVDASRGKIYLDSPVAPGDAAPPTDGDMPCGQPGSAENLLATKIKVAVPGMPSGTNISGTDGLFVFGDIFSATQQENAAADIAKMAESAYPSHVWILMPKANSTQLSPAAASIHGAISRGYKNICAIIPSVYSRTHVDQARNNTLSTGIDLSGIELGITVDSPAGAVMACEFAQSGVSVVCIDSDMLIKNMFGLENSEAPPGLDTHPAFLQILERCIRACRKQKMHTAFFGAASCDPRMIEKLVEYGIDSICVPEDKASMARYMAARAEKKMLIDILKNRDRYYRKDGM